MKRHKPHSFDSSVVLVIEVSKGRNPAMDVERERELSNRLRIEGD
jgi:hypothetical protein